MFREEFAEEGLLRVLGATMWSGTDQPMALYNAAFDGSGTLGQHKAIAYAGVKGSDKQWAAFAEAWAQRIGADGLAFFKMAEAMKWSGEFASKYTQWGADRDKRRDALIDDLVSLSIGYGLDVVGIAATDRLIVGDTAAARKMQLFKGAMLALLNEIPAIHTVTVMCDTELDIEADVRAWMREVRKTSDRNIPALSGICFLDDRVYPSLQLADMVAWLFRAGAETGLLQATSHTAPAPLRKLLGKRELGVSHGPNLDPDVIRELIRRTTKGDDE